MDANSLGGADLREADLESAKLRGTILIQADLSKANLHFADLTKVYLSRSDLSDARLAFVDLTGASYAPASAGPPSPHAAGLRGLETVTFPPGHETGLVQLREQLQRAGLRHLERQATFAIERGRTQHAIDTWRQDPARAAEGVFRLVAFDLTTAYGFRPGRSLLIIGALWALLIPVYAWSIRRPLSRTDASSGIYRIWPEDRIELEEGETRVKNPPWGERLHHRGLAAIGWAAYFSLLSAFHIGFREFSVGTWIARVQPREYVLKAAGWVRTVSGLQSLLSVYLLALWVLTYFGRPFQ